MKAYLNFLFLGLSVFLIFSCNQPKPTLFKLVSSEHSGIDFENTIYESDSFNVITEEYIYNGGGVGVGDFNNDGFPDLYFTGNMVSNKLYLNEGNLRFKDITEVARVNGEGKWCSGVAVIDINQDGWNDIYVASTLKKDSLSRRNLLYVNQGLNEENIPTFKESALEYGIADHGNSTNAAFFDYDKDGDLDLYVLTNVISEKIPVMFRDQIVDGTAVNNDRLYRNNGNGTFTNVSVEAGILMEGYGLGVAISDINLDGWPDIYVANDYISNDLLYINNQDGTFTNKITDYIKHTCFSSMGTDVVDINNDGFVDIISLDMLPENNIRKKMMVKDNNYITYVNFDRYNYQHQYVRNVLQLNQGMSPSGHPVFSEVGQFAGIYQTDWSWTPLVADFDNDGLRDLIVTNGYPKDVTDRDFAVYRAGNAGAVSSNLKLAGLVPEVKISNYGFKNKGNVNFENNTTDWGLDVPSFSNGAVYADLDNDGDLDVVINNINQEAFLFKNQLYDVKSEDQNHFLRIELKGNNPKSNILGTKLRIWYDNGKTQFYEHSPYRGYLSTIENAAHFGLGTSNDIDSIQIYWPNGDYQFLTNVKADQKIVIDQKSSGQKLAFQPANSSNTPHFKEVSSEFNIKFKHKEADRIDFNLQRTMPHKLSQLGPGISVGDIDGNGLDDFYLGGSAGKKGCFFIQSDNGTFTLDSLRIQDNMHSQEDMGSLFFDADSDNDLDLYVVSGSYEFDSESPLLVDKFYRNSGKGFFALDATAIPEVASSGSCVRAADFDKDGDLDLFVAGRVIPAKYPMAPSSYILKNDGGKFIDATKDICPGLTNLGMVSDALWTDFDNDNQIDLIIAGEWMPITFYKNSSGVLKNVTEQSGIGELIGWWNSLSPGDFDNDGDMDYLAGNLGQNTHYTASKEHPLSVYAKDFDNNGRFKAILSCYIKDDKGEMKPFPMPTRDDLVIQMPSVKKKFSTYGAYSTATINEVLTPAEREGAIILSANYFSSSYIENLGAGKFKITELPQEVQYAPVFGMISNDFDNDGNLDALIVGNDYGTEVFTGRYDAMIGLYLKGDGKGKFSSIPVSKSGFFVDGDAKGMAELYTKKGEKLIIVTQNRDSLKVFSKIGKAKEVNNPNVLPLNSNDSWAELTFNDGKKQKVEFYYGSTYLSQSSRKFEIQPNLESIDIFQFSGEKRTIKF